MHSTQLTLLPPAEPYFCSSSLHVSSAALNLPSLSCAAAALPISSSSQSQSARYSSTTRCKAATQGQQHAELSILPTLQIMVQLWYQTQTVDHPKLKLHAYVPLVVHSFVRRIRPIIQINKRLAQDKAQDERLADLAHHCMEHSVEMFQLT
jgi:hypothetical protein